MADFAPPPRAKALDKDLKRVVKLEEATREAVGRTAAVGFALVFIVAAMLLAFAAVAFLMVLLAENARIPVDNPATHLELTMIHEAMILEYSARHLALIEWASAIKLYAYMTIGIALFAPWGIAEGSNWAALPFALLALVVKLALAGAGLALIETVSAKFRVFRAPEFLSTAFLLAVLGMLIHFLVRH